jgi:transposase-like protein
MLRVGRSTMTHRPKTYTPVPSVPPELMERFALVQEVLAGKRSVSEAARRLGISRNRFQTILHRGMGALVESIAPQPGGRPSRPKDVALLEAEIARLKRENARLQERVDTSDRMLQVVSGLLQGRLRPARQPRTRKTAKTDEKNEAEPQAKLEVVDRMKSLGLSSRCAAIAAGVHESTVRRWRRAVRGARPAVATPSSVPGELESRAAAVVRSLKGLIGAQSLACAVQGLSRRQAARVKAATLTLMERERKAALVRVCVSVPGVVRGMDGMHLRGSDGPAHALFAADAAIPYRTTVKVAMRYDRKLVTRALACDLETNGAPLVYRLDRAKAHDTEEVSDLLAAHEVLLLHGPPKCPRFYGQLERQNREHRAWADDVATLPLSEVEPYLRDMLAALNDLWPRRTLGWKTAREAWNSRPQLGIDRKALREEVNERAARIRSQPQCRGKPADLAQRLAIEQALQARGFLRQTVGGWC